VFDVAYFWLEVIVLGQQSTGMDNGTAA